MDLENAAEHKFLENSNLSYQEVFDFSFKSLIPVLKDLAKELGEEQVYEILKRIVYESALKGGQTTAGDLPCNDFEAFKLLMKESSPFWEHVFSMEIVEDTPETIEVKVSECLWAKTFREMGAEDLGYLLVCYRDYADCKGFNPKITMVRSKTLMQGDEYCNHRFLWGG